MFEITIDKIFDFIKEKHLSKEFAEWVVKNKK